MRQRGSCFRNWSKSPLRASVHEEVLDNGTQVETRARLSTTGGTQLFIGIYKDKGACICEELYMTLAEHNITRAVTVGKQRARAIAAGRTPPLLITNRYQGGL